MSHVRVFGLLMALGLMSMGSVAVVAQDVIPDNTDVRRTAWGDPNVQGIWDFRTITPFERPDELAGKDVLTAEEAAEYEQRTLALRNKDRRTEDGLSAAADVASAYNQFWWDYGDKLTEDRRTSLVVDPPNGKMPELTAVARTRSAVRRAARRRDAHWTVDRGVAERCILGFNAGPPMNPSAYNNNVQIFQAPGYVVLLNEMVHDSRIVRLDGDHLPQNIRQWRGDSRGYWQGDTLVVETTNFTDKTSFRGSGPTMVLRERFTRVSGGTLLYEYTIDDPVSFARPWSVAVPMTETDQPLFEYACHEGNYGMLNLMEGARAVDAKKATLKAAKTR